MSELKLTDVELSAILSEAESEGVNWVDSIKCPGSIVVCLDGTLGVDDSGSCYDTARGKEVSNCTTPGNHKIIAHNATDALTWMHRSGLVQSAASARREARS